MTIGDYGERRNMSGDRVREARVRYKYSQAELAAKAQCEGVDFEQDTISRIENGQRMVQDFELKTLANLLGVTTDWLLELD